MFQLSFFATIFSLISLAIASHDFTGEAIGLGTKKAVLFDFDSTASPSPWNVFSTTGPKAKLDSSAAKLTVKDGDDASIITSNFAFWYGSVTWKAKIATGSVITSFKISGAYSGIGLLVDGTEPNQIIGTFNGTSSDKDKVGVWKDLSQDYHDFTISWGSSKISWLVDGTIFKVLEISSFTNPIDVSNWPTTPDTVNAMIESTVKTGTSSHSAYLQSINVQDVTGGKYYEYVNDNIKVTTTGDSYKTSKGKTVEYSSDLKKWVAGDIQKRDTSASSSTAFASTTAASNTTVSATLTIAASSNITSNNSYSNNAEVLVSKSLGKFGLFAILLTALLL